MWTICKTKKERVAKVRALLETNDKAVQRAILRIYAAQTCTEQNSQSTHDSNGVGFNSCDAEFLSSLAQKLQRGYILSPAQMLYGRKAILKYSGQLARIAEQEEPKIVARAQLIAQPELLAA